MPKQTTVGLPEDSAAQADAVARAQGSSVNRVIVEALHAERDRQILDRLAP